MVLGLEAVIYLLSKLGQLGFNHLIMGGHGMKHSIDLFDGLIKTLHFAWLDIKQNSP